MTTIFVVDDDISVQRSLRRLLVSADYHVIVCGSAEEFLTITHWPHPSCLVADVRMPGMTGLDLHEFLLQTGRDIPIILTSGQADAATIARARQSEAIAFLKKPFDADELFRAIERGLARARESGQSPSALDEVDE